MQTGLKRTITALVLASAAVFVFLGIFMTRPATPIQTAEEYQTPPAAITQTDDHAALSTTMAAPDTPNQQKAVPRNHRAGKVKSVKSVSAPVAADYETAAASAEVFTEPLISSEDSVETQDTPTASAQESLAEPSAQSSDDHLALVPPIVPPAAPEPAVSSHMSGRASALLSQIRTEGAQLKLNAETLGTFAWNFGLSWQSHAFYLDRVKSHINAVGTHIGELEQIRHSVLPWQQQAIDEVTSHAVQVAASTQSAIRHLRENQDRLFVSEYRNHLVTIESRSADMKETLDKFHEYQQIRDKYEGLRNQLELAGD